MRLLTAGEMRELDRRAMEEFGIPGVVLMENAGRAAAEVLASRYAERFPGPVLVLAGKGNNGGDGYVIARHLLQRGWKVHTVVLCAPGLIVGAAAVNLEILRRIGAPVSFLSGNDWPESSPVEGANPQVLIDALLGTGLTSEIRGIYAQAIDWINASGLPVVAVDIPSGVGASDGRILGRSVRADLTVTFACAKVGQVTFPGAGSVGDLDVVDIGIPPILLNESPSDHLLVEAAEAASLLPARPLVGHKGTFGHLLVVGGSTGKTGAAAMAASGALRIGAGLVTVACPEREQPVLAQKLTEAMTVPLPGGGALNRAALEDLPGLWRGKSALALGPGLGQKGETCDCIYEIIRSCPLPLVLDADGLNAVALDPGILRQRACRSMILTPHPGEMARLVNRSVPEVQANRLEIARDFAREYDLVLVLKGARTVTALPDGRVFLNSTGNPGMASGGTGDVLTGMAGGLLAQGLSAGDAAVLAVFLHGDAGDRLQSDFGDAGMMATDLLRKIPVARNHLQQLKRMT